MDTSKFMLLRGERILRQIFEYETFLILPEQDEEELDPREPRRDDLKVGTDLVSDRDYPGDPNAAGAVPKYWNRRPPPKGKGITYGELERNVMNFRPPSKKRQHALAPLIVTEMEFQPVPNANNLLIRGQVNNPQSETKVNPTYSPQILFSQVEYHQPENEEEVANPNTITMTSNTGNDFTISPIRMNDNHAKVQCNCLDFWWRFSIYNHRRAALMGYDVGFYQKKTNRPPVNPDQVPAMCKHLLKMAIELKNNGVLV